MKLRIESDGTASGTKVLTEDGERIEGIQSLTWHCDCGAHQLAAVTIKLIRMPVNVVGRLEE